jgi:RNA polymerase sigma-70 factor (family 1)
LKPFEDIELIIRLQNDEVSAFDTLYWKYHSAIYANVLKLVKDEATTGDIVQEVFLTLWEKRLLLDTSQSVAGWLFVVSYNKSVTLLKKSLRETRTQKSLQASSLNYIDEDIYLADAQWEIVEKAIGRLSPQKRKVFELCKMQGKSYTETAAELGLSRHTVKEYLSDAVAFVKSFVQQHSGQVAFVSSSLFIDFFCH